MWVELSISYVMPGLRLCEDISVTSNEEDPEQMKKKIRDLDTWAKNASSEVAAIARQVSRQS